MMTSIIEYFGETGQHYCGYCKQTMSHTHGMWAHRLSVQDYQNLINRGWRRSGKYCYKPTMNITCCPMYTIRCDSPNFKLTKSQKKILKTVNKFLCSNKNETDSATITESSQNDVEMESENFVASYSSKNIRRDISLVKPLEINNGSTSKPCLSENVNRRPSVDKSLIKEEVISTDFKTGCGADPSKPPCKKAKQIRLQKKLDKLGATGESVVKKIPKNKEKSLEDFINEIPESARNRLQIKLVRTNPPSPEWEATSTISHSLYLKYQTTIHNDKPEKCTEKKFQDFLVKSPLQSEESPNGPPMGYGSFHQQYWLDGELIAVGVIDILQNSVSSVFFFYDPKYSFLSLGTYGALRELEFVRKIQRDFNELRYYYMGFYIHSCQKMRYKGNFHPSYLLCPETFAWFTIEDSIKAIEASKYARLNPDLDAIDQEQCAERDVDNILVLIGNGYVKYSIYKLQKGRESSSKSKKRSTDSMDDANLLEFAQLVGTKCYNRLIYVKD